MRSFAELLPYYALYPPGKGVVQLKSGDLLAVFKVQPSDLYFKDEKQIEGANNALLSMIRLLPGWTFYFDLHRRRKIIASPPFDPQAPKGARDFGALQEEVFYINEMYLSFIRQSEEEENPLNFLLSQEGERRTYADEAYIDFLEKLRLVENELQQAYSRVKWLGGGPLCSYLHSTFGGPQRVNPPSKLDSLDYYLSDVRFKKGEVPQVDDTLYLIGGVHGYPAETSAGVFNAVFELPVEFRYTLRGMIQRREVARKKLATVQKFALIQEDKGSLTDLEAVGRTEEAIAATALISDGVVKKTITLQVRGENYKALKADFKKIQEAFQQEGYLFKTETLNAPAAFLGAIPGNLEYDPRRRLVGAANAVHFTSFSGSWPGEERNEFLGGLTGNDAPLLVARSGTNLFYLNLTVGDVGHTMVFGPTGAGKSIFLGTSPRAFCATRKAGWW